MKSYFFYTDQLTVGYDGKPLIKEINIQLNKGDILTLIGPNGAGTDEPDDQQGSVKKTGCSTYRAHATGAYDL